MLLRGGLWAICVCVCACVSVWNMVLNCLGIVSVFHWRWKTSCPSLWDRRFCSDILAAFTVIGFSWLHCDSLEASLFTRANLHLLNWDAFLSLLFKTRTSFYIVVINAMMCILPQCLEIYKSKRFKCMFYSISVLEMDYFVHCWYSGSVEPGKKLQEDVFWASCRIWACMKSQQ